MRSGWDGRAVKVGIMGAGFAARAHAVALRNCGGAELCAVYSPVIEERRVFSRDYRCDHFESGAELIQGCELIVVATPNSTHKQWSLAALQAGKHVLCEKPLAVSTSEAEELVRAGGPDQLSIIGFNYRYTPIIAGMKAALDDELIGAPREFHFKFYKDSALRKPASGWKVEAGQGGTGGVIGDLGIHFIDLVRWLFQKAIPQEDYLSISNVHSIMQNGVDVTASIEGIACGQVKVIAELAKNYSGPGLGVSLQLIGTNGTIQYHSAHPSEYRLITGKHDEMVHLKYSTALADPIGEPSGWSDSFLLQAVDMVRSITGGSLCGNLATFEDGCLAQHHLAECLDNAVSGMHSAFGSRPKPTESSLQERVP